MVMGGKIVFDVTEEQNILCDPRDSFRIRREKMQVRRDPLTGKTVHLSHFGAIKPQRLPVERYGDPEIRGFCPFCTDVRYRVTPKFPESILSEGRLLRGEACLVPNLYPYDVYSGVVIMTNEHVVPLDAFTEQCLIDAFSVGVEFLKRVAATDNSFPYHIAAWNYMPPSGGGLVHPHQQYFATRFPGNLFMDEWNSAREFTERHDTNYWDELAEAEEAAGERFIGASGSVKWFSSFAPLGVLGEVMGIFPSVYSIRDFAEGHIADLVAGLGRLFQYYQDNGISSFNTSLTFGAAGQQFFLAHFRIIPRTFLNVRDYAPDLCFYQSLLQESVSVAMPEELCREVKPYFAG